MRAAAAFVAAGFLVGPVPAVPASPGADPAVDLRLELDPIVATVGDPIRVRLKVGTPAGWTLRTEEPGIDWGALAVRSGSWSGPVQSSDARLEWVWEGILAAYRTGELELPPWTLRLSGPGGEAAPATPARRIRIDSVLPSSPAEGPLPDIADLKPPVSLRPDWSPLRRAAALTAGLLVAAAAGAWLYRRLSLRLAREPVPDDPFRRQPPHEWAFEALQRLLEDTPSDGSGVEQVFARLSIILKRYVEGRYRLNLRDATTSEAAHRLRRGAVPAETCSTLIRLLELCDRVKFAGETPGPLACRSAVEEAYRLVDRNRPAGDAAEQKARRGAA